MEYLEHEEVAYCTVFNLKLSQDELEVYESCMKYVLEKCNEKEIFDLTGCKINELKAWQEEIRKLIITHVDEEILSEKYKKQK
jgi:hypothetical protein